MFTKILQNYLENQLNAPIVQAKPLSGGSINAVYRILTKTKNYVLKINFADRFPGMFEAEKRGLETLKNARCIPVPQVFFTGTFQNQAFILLEYLSPAPAASDMDENFGRALAALHQNTHTHFGLSHSNYIGSLPQTNQFHDNWPDFYREERLQPQIKMAVDSGWMDKNDIKNTEKLYLKLSHICPEEPPSLIHGDLWSGNFIINKKGQAALIDPAVAFAHRELELSMTHLFGGFSKQFYHSYQEAWPLEPGYEERIPIFQLYFILVHVNLFGGHYISKAKKILSNFL